ncbi:MAG: T9SS type A sorting domain-containing protein, partial [Bacteroidota bacterium]
TSAQEETPEELGAPAIRLFPNPTHRLTTLEIENLGPDTQIQYGLYTLTGQRLWSKVGGQREKIEVQGLAKGVYLLRVQAGDWSEVKQLVVH